MKFSEEKEAYLRIQKLLQKLYQDIKKKKQGALISNIRFQNDIPNPRSIPTTLP